MSAVLSSPAIPMHVDVGLFKSFWMAGYEGADHVNSRGIPLDMVHASRHQAHLDADYALLSSWRIRTIRESVGWRLSERDGRFDFSRARHFACAARRHGLQILWTLMHYGTPPDVSLLDDAFCERFARFVAEAAKALGDLSDQPIYTPINEMSFVAWAASQTLLLHPYGKDAEKVDGATIADGFHIKCRLVRATLMAMQAIKEVDPRARFLHVEPIVHVVPPQDQPHLQELADQVCAYQWQTWDMLCGRLLPELGGRADCLDLIGVNHYHNGQWEVLTERRLHWHLKDPRRRCFSLMLQDVWQRYERPLLVAETSHVGQGRADWLEDMALEAEHALSRGVPLLGMCLYPIVDRPDWDDANHWHHSGLWDHCEPPHNPSGWPRRLDIPYAAALSRWQARLPGHS